MVKEIVTVRLGPCSTCLFFVNLRRLKKSLLNLERLKFSVCDFAQYHVWYFLIFGFASRAFKQNLFNIFKNVFVNRVEFIPKPSHVNRQDGCRIC